MDMEGQLKAHRRATETAVSRIRKARNSGASLYLTDMKTEDVEAVLRYAPDMVDLWLDGFREDTVDFRRRVHLAETAFMALCEALLTYEPTRGAQLWRVLSATVTTRYIGAAGVDDLLHMVFRVPESTVVIALREELLDLERCHTDLALFDLAIAASHNGKADWLAAVIQADRASARAWRRKRGEVLAGFTINNMLPIAGAWPDGEIRTGHAELGRKSARFRWSDACARHWWRVYLAASDPMQAYAAWVCFLRSADRRARIWMHEDIKAASEASPFSRLKLRHLALNNSKLGHALEKRTDKLDRTFLGREII